MKHIWIVLLLLFSVASSVSAQDDGVYVVISRQIVNVRETPSLTGDILNGLGSGVQVAVTRAVVGDSYVDSTTWYEVVVDGATGYVHSSLLRRITGADLATNGAAADADTRIVPEDGAWRLTFANPFTLVCGDLDAKEVDAAEFADDSLFGDGFLTAAADASRFNIDGETFVRQPDGNYTTTMPFGEFVGNFSLVALSPTSMAGFITFTGERKAGEVDEDADDEDEILTCRGSGSFSMARQ
jgi:hypothetical protein